MKYVKFIYCPVCGEKMREDQRNCYKCGHLNYANPLNRNLKEYDKVQNNNKKFINDDKSNLPIFNKSNNDKPANNIGNLKVFFIVNLLMLIIPLLIIIYIFNNNYLNIYFPVTIISFLFIYLLNISLQLLFIKSNNKWWFEFIPIYNLYTLNNIVFNKKIYFICTFIPVVNIIYYFILLYRLGVVFGKNPILTMLFSIIYIPIIGFNNDVYYNNINYIVQYKGNNFIEGLYKYKKIFKRMWFIAFAISIIILVFCFL